MLWAEDNRQFFPPVRCPLWEIGLGNNLWLITHLTQSDLSSPFGNLCRGNSISTQEFRIGGQERAAKVANLQPAVILLARQNLQ